MAVKNNIVYTAQELRDFADAIARDLNDNGHRSVTYTYDELIPVIESLRQGADALERKKRRVKRVKREYAVKWLDDNSVSNNMGERHDFAESVVRAVGASKAQLVSREVGEWEEVKDGK